MSGWISVKERLPEIETLVFFCVDGFDSADMGKHIGGGVFWSVETDCDGVPISYKDVTHWMPLPDPPKQ